MATQTKNPRLLRMPSEIGANARRVQTQGIGNCGNENFGGFSDKFYLNPKGSSEVSQVTRKEATHTDDIDAELKQFLDEFNAKVRAGRLRAVNWQIKTRE